MKNVLVTGSAGFIGAALCRRLLQIPDLHVTSVDNINDYYDPALKLARLRTLGIDTSGELPYGAPAPSSEPRHTFIRLNLEDDSAVDRLFADRRFDTVIHLAAQAGVRYSITNPRAYIRSNIDGFINILEGCRQTAVSHLIYASSSSVYGLNGEVPFSESHSTEHPVSLYAATKKSDEMMAHADSTLYGLPTTGLRFFTVYGPWGRPDMSPYLFIDAILNDRPIKVFNHGDMWRDFTYIDDIVESIARLIGHEPEGNPSWDARHPDPATSTAPYRIYNIGNQQPVRLMDYIETIERIAGREAKKEYLPMQPGDVYRTYADSSALGAKTGFTPSTPLAEGLARTIDWYRTYTT